MYNSVAFTTLPQFSSFLSQKETRYPLKAFTPHLPLSPVSDKHKILLSISKNLHTQSILYK